MSASLSPAEIERFRQSGYLAPLPGLGGEECRALRGEVEGFGRRHGVKEQLILRNKAHLKMPGLERVVRDGRILDAVEGILGPNILCWGSSLFIKEAGGPELVAYHQDSYYWDIEGFDVVVAWVALIPSTLENGAMRVVPGSHAEPARPHGASPTGSTNMLFSYEEIAVEVSEAETVPLLLEAGEFSLHHMAIIHGSPPNRSNDRRMGYSITYLNPKVRHLGRRTTGLLVRGDDWGHFQPDPVATREMDPEVLAFIDRQFGSSVPVSALNDRPSQDFYRKRATDDVAA